MNFGAAEAIARAVLYEGYILYPYRPSAIKNRQRWTFGGIFPRDFSEGTGSDPCTMQTQCLVWGLDPIVDMRVQFLHLVAREVGVLPNPVAELPPDCEPEFTPVPSLEIDGTRFIAWEEVVEREVDAGGVELRHRLDGSVRIPFGFSGARQIEPLRRADGLVAGLLRRTALAVQDELTIGAEQVADDAFRLTVRIENLSSCESSEIADRNQVQRRALVAAHTILGVRGGAFVSLMDPPEDLREAAFHCDNRGTWPVLVGEAGQTAMLLSSPIILYDYPQIAPESPGDFFDGTEIDENADSAHSHDD